jgi:hypothetical protein
MPLLDHSAPPLRRSHPWRGFHSAWASSIARQLNREVLPEGFYAIPNVELDGAVEIDVATLRERLADAGEAGDLALWSPPEPAQTLTLEFPPLKFVEVQVLADEDDPRLIAAVELVSPSNKDRPSSRRALALKCVSYLQQGSGVLIVDVIRERLANFHEEVLKLLEQDVSGVWRSPTDLYAVAYRATGTEERRLDTWREPITVGQALPRMPLWLGVDVCVPVDLEASYNATCDDLRVRVAG